MHDPWWPGFPAFVLTVIVGGLVGWIASVVMKTRAQMGVVANVVVGILGSAVGHWLFGLLGLMAYGTVGRLIVNVGGAMVLIALLKGFGVYR